MQEGQQIFEFLAFFAAVVILIPLFYRFKVTPFLAFIASGILLGPYCFRVIQSVSLSEKVGDIGLLFLMFSIGLDMSFHRFKAMRKNIFLVGGTQMVLCALVFGLAAFCMKRTVDESILIGVALAMSSSAVVFDLLPNYCGLNSPAGRATIGMLIMQDLMVIPLMILIPRMASDNGASSLDDVVQATLRSIGAITAIILIGRTVLRPLFKSVANTKVQEAFMCMIFLAFFTTVWATKSAGLSVSLGAFLAGMLIAETEFSHEVESQVKPFEGLLLGVFFLSVGMRIDLPYVFKHIPQLLLLTSIFLATKTCVIYLMMRKFKHTTDSAWSCGTLLCQCSEFGFVVFTLASKSIDGMPAIMSPNTASQLQVVVALSMSLTPLVCGFVFKKLDIKTQANIAARDAAAPADLANESIAMTDHVIVVGYGRVGQAATRMLFRNEIPMFVIDTDITHIERAKKNNRPFVFGSAANEGVLKVANIKEAKSVLICISNQQSALRVLQAVREMNKDVPVFIRANDDSRWAELTKNGATGVISETQECGIRLAASLIMSINGDEEKMRETAAVIRQEHIANQPLSSNSEV
ncbi:MAG: cation:proton antiporter [Alphaproteobacteria bacterium]|nr:cation:proton antiporter [Alphaproteobacteria bacterium]